jgi:hypothetical protein
VRSAGERSVLGLPCLHLHTYLGANIHAYTENLGQGLGTIHDQIGLGCDTRATHFSGLERRQREDLVSGLCMMLGLLCATLIKPTADNILPVLGVCHPETGMAGNRFWPLDLLFPAA